MQASHRTFLFCRNSAAKHTADLSDAGCPMPNPWRLFSAVDSLDSSEVSLLFKCLESEFRGHVVDDGSASAASYEFHGADETVLETEPVQAARLRTEWEVIRTSYSLAPHTESEHSNTCLLHERAQALAEQIRKSRNKAASGSEDVVQEGSSPIANPATVELTPGLATVLTACVCLNCLEEMRRYYPDALTEAEARDLHQQLTASIELWLQAETGEQFKSIYKRPDFAVTTNESILVLMVTITMHLIGDMPSSEIQSAMAQVFRRAQEMAVEPVNTACRRLSELEIFTCRSVVVTAGPEFADPRRALQLLDEYWGVVRHLVSIDSGAYVFHVPHPLLATIVNLRDRIDACFQHLHAVSGWEDAKETIEAFLDVLESSDLDDLQAVPERTNRRLANAELFLQQSRLRLGRKTFPLTRAEQSFLAVARWGVDKYERDVVEGKKRTDVYLKEVGKERREQHREQARKAEDTGVRSTPSEAGRNDASQVNGSKIPPEERTIPMSYKRAASLMGKGRSKDAAEWLSASVRDGSIRCEYISRQSHVFSKNDFPKSVWPQILPQSGRAESV